MQIAAELHWGTKPRKNCEIHIAAFLSRQPLVKGERLVRYEVNAVMLSSCASREAAPSELKVGNTECQMIVLPVMHYLAHHKLTSPIFDLEQVWGKTTSVSITAFTS